MEIGIKLKMMGEYRHVWQFSVQSLLLPMDRLLEFNIVNNPKKQNKTKKQFAHLIMLIFRLHLT